MILRAAALIVTLALGLLAAPLAADAQPPAEVPRIGYLGNVSGSAAPYLDSVTHQRQSSSQALPRGRSWNG